MNFQRFLGAMCLLLCGGMLHAANSVDVRLIHSALDQQNNALYVNIEVRVDNANQINLAGQNYRIYFPSDKLTLNTKESKSQLPTSVYSDLQISSLIENVAASGQGNIQFDNNLGFANLLVDLKDLENGGTPLSKADGWVTMATLKFDIKKDIDQVSMIWGREGMSEDYATAFVELAEWEAPQKTNTIIIDEYIDLDLHINEFSTDGVDYEITVGPNPGVEYVELRSNQALQSTMDLRVTDMAGKLVTSTQWQKGSTSHIIDVTELSPSSYRLIISGKDKTILSTPLVIAK